MKGFIRSLRTGALIFFIFFLIGMRLTGESTVSVTGTVLYSFSEPYVLIQTKDYVARIIVSRLTPQQKSQLKSVGSTIAVEVPRSAVDLVWPVDPNKNETLVVNNPLPPAMLESVKGQQNQIHLSGKVLSDSGSEPNKSERSIQVGSYIYRINISTLSRDLQKTLTSPNAQVSVAIPTKSILFAWRFTNSDRAPASTPKRETVEYKDGVALIVGRALNSFSEPHVLVQSKGRIYQLKKDALSADEIAQTSKVGNEVTLLVPTGAIQFEWSAGQ